jgi:hypothetical protein
MSTTSFHPFPYLPLELQQQIWDHLLPPFPRIVILPSVYTVNVLIRTSEQVDPYHELFSTLSEIDHRSVSPVETIHYAYNGYFTHEVAFIRRNIDVLFVEDIGKHANDFCKFDVECFLSMNQGKIKSLAILSNLHCDAEDLIEHKTCVRRIKGRGTAQLVRGLEGLEMLYFMKWVPFGELGASLLTPECRDGALAWSYKSLIRDIIPEVKARYEQNRVKMKLEKFGLETVDSIFFKEEHKVFASSRWGYVYHYRNQ